MRGRGAGRYSCGMGSETLAGQASPVRSRKRGEIPDRFKWNVDDIFASWPQWDAAYKELDAGIERYAALKGTLSQGPEALQTAFRCRKSSASSRIASGISRRCSTTKTSATTPSTRGASGSRSSSRSGNRPSRGSAPNCCAIPLDTVRGWMDRVTWRSLLYRFAIENLYRQQEHVLDDAGERLMSLPAAWPPRPTTPTRRCRRPTRRFPTVDLSSGEERDGVVRPVSRHPRDAARAVRSREGVRRAARNV